LHSQGQSRCCVMEDLLWMDVLYDVYKAVVPLALPSCKLLLCVSFASKLLTHLQPCALCCRWSTAT